jgi:hypothetical protein
MVRCVNKGAANGCAALWIKREPGPPLIPTLCNRQCGKASKFFGIRSVADRVGVLGDNLRRGLTRSCGCHIGKKYEQEASHAASN